MCRGLFYFGLAINGLSRGKLFFFDQYLRFYGFLTIYFEIDFEIPKGLYFEFHKILTLASNSNLFEVSSIQGECSNIHF